MRGQLRRGPRGLLAMGFCLPFDYDQGLTLTRNVMLDCSSGWQGSDFWLENDDSTYPCYEFLEDSYAQAMRDGEWTREPQSKIDPWLVCFLVNAAEERFKLPKILPMIQRFNWLLLYSRLWYLDLWLTQTVYSSFATLIKEKEWQDQFH